MIILIITGVCIHIPFESLFVSFYKGLLFYIFCFVDYCSHHWLDFWWFQLFFQYLAFWMSCFYDCMSLWLIFDRIVLFWWSRSVLSIGLFIIFILFDGDPFPKSPRTIREDYWKWIPQFFLERILRLIFFFDNLCFLFIFKIVVII